MKKIVKVLLVLFALVFCFTFVNAADFKPTTAKAPETLPDTNETVQAVLDEPFDYSKISFSSSDGQATITGRSIMRKIMLTLTPNASGNTIEEKLGDSWFTAYCLDGELKFPLYSYTNFNFSESASDDLKLQQVMMFALFNNGSFRDAFLKAKGMIMDPTINYQLSADETSTSVLAAIDAGEEVTVTLNSIVYVDAETLNTITITPADLTGNASDTTYSLVLKKENMMFDNYYAKLLDNKNYTHALWIIEHSYPTLDIRTSLMMADASYTNLITEIKALHQELSLTDEEWEKLTENYVYSTVQYAIWRVNNSITDGNAKLGNELIGSSELNKLYQYLIKDRSEYEGYYDKQFTNTLDLKKPDSKKEIFSETKDYYVYGPYSVEYSLISLDRVDISIDGLTSDKASLVDESGATLTSITPNQNFYIKVAKNAKIANLKVNLSTQNALTFFPSTNRGRIYTSYYPLVQNVVSGGKIVNTDISKSVDIIFNPKTGVEDIAVLFAITLVAFSIGYLALVFKSKPVKF